LSRGPDDGLFNLNPKSLGVHRASENGATRRSAPCAQGEHHKQKARLLQPRVQTQEGQLMKVEDHNNLTDAAIGVILTALSSWPALVAGGDLALRRKAEDLLLTLRRKIPKALHERADAAGEPPLNEQG
jgi:hypothetical protein